MSQTKQIIPGSGWDVKEWMAVICIIIGVALLSAGITIWAKEGLSQGWYRVSIGITLIFLPFLVGLINQSKGKIKHDYPTASSEKLSKGDKAQVVLLTLAFALLIIGIGVALSSALLTLRYGWAFAQNFLFFGLIAAGAPMLLLVILGSIFIK